MLLEGLNADQAKDGVYPISATISMPCGAMYMDWQAPSSLLSTSETTTTTTTTSTETHNPTASPTPGPSVGPDAVPIPDECKERCRDSDNPNLSPRCRGCFLDIGYPCECGESKCDVRSPDCCASGTCDALCPEGQDPPEDAPECCKKDRETCEWLNEPAGGGRMVVTATVATEVWVG